MQALYFLLPLLIIYEIGAILVLPQTGMQLTAARLLGQFFEFFGVTGVHFPAFAIVGILIAMHISRKTDPWTPEPKLYAFMFLESAFLSIPLFVLMTVLFTHPTAAAAITQSLGVALPNLDHMNWPMWRQTMVIALGAGLYEELVFRLIAISLISMVAEDLLALPKEICIGLAVGLSSLGFAVVHFGPGNPFEVTRFLFYFVTGVYFAAIYLSRGFGIVVGVHALYDVLVYTKAVYQNG